MLESAQLVYNAHGILVKCGAPMCVELSPHELEKYSRIDGGCTWGVSSGEFLELHRRGNVEVGFGEIGVYFVPSMATKLQGCAGHLPLRPACILTSDAHSFLLAHEVGHVLLTSAFMPFHSQEVGNLMMEEIDVIDGETPTLNDKQLAKIMRSPYLHRI